MRFVISTSTVCVMSAVLAFACGGGDDQTAFSPDAAIDGGAIGDAISDSSLSDSSLLLPDGAPLSPGARNWAEFPSISQVDGATEIWAVSDVHGDYAALTKLFAGAGIVASAPATPAAAVWNQGTAVLVVVGDLIDKGPDAPDVVRFMIALQASAAAAGGKVVVTMGNHEAEFLADPNNSKASGAAGVDSELVAIGLTPDATAAGDDDIGVFIRNLPIAARIDDWFFVHAGKTGGLSISALASAIQSGVDTSGFGATVLAADDSLLEARLNASSPQWWDATNDPAGLLASWSSAVGARHLVMGHQPGAVGFTSGPNRKNDQMFAAYGGALFLIDTGLSVGVDATGGALLHVKNAGTATVSWEEILPDGSKKSL